MKALSSTDQVLPRAAKVLLQHIALAHKDWLPSGAMPMGHVSEAQAVLHALIGEQHCSLLRCCPIVAAPPHTTEQGATPMGCCMWTTSSASMLQMCSAEPHTLHQGARRACKVCHAAQHETAHHAEISDTHAACADGMRSYFLPPRFYSTEFPFTGLKLKMVGSGRTILHASMW